VIEKDRDLDSYEISCDFCSEDIEIEADTWDDMLEQTKELGW